MYNEGFAKDQLSIYANADKDTIAISLYDGQKITDFTYARLLEDVLKAAGYFKKNHIHGQHIALLAPNSYEWIVVFYGIVASGNVAVMMNYSLPCDLLQQQCEQADVSMIWSDASVNPEFRTVINDKPWLDYDEIIAAEPISFDDIYVSTQDETIALAGTSGTTGKSKIIELSSNNLHSAVEINIQHSWKVNPTFGIPGKNRALLWAPLYHVGGLMTALVVLQANPVLCIGRGVKDIFADLPILNPTYLPIVPSLMDSVEKIFRIASTPEERSKYLGNNLQRLSTFGASTKSATCKYLIKQGIAIETGYGMTETSGLGLYGLLTEDKITTVGTALNGVQCRICNGEIQFKSPAVMKGYYKDPEETAKVIEDGWIHTGDMGYFDEDGYCYITGRKKNVMVLSNGENVNPEEVEATLDECEAIVECMVYSNGKGICADVYAADQQKASEYIQKYNESMPVYHKIYKVNYSETPLEKTGTGKIKRKGNAL